MILRPNEPSKNVYVVAMTVSNLARISDHPNYLASSVLVTRAQLMRRWVIKSPNTIKRYVKLGMPEERLPGGSPRYDLFACEDWRREIRG